jgi:hypothetical protein
MARYVVLEFDDNNDAQQFIERVNAENAENRRDRLSFRRRVVAIFVKPGTTCYCWDWQHTNYGDKNREHGIARGEKFGWWVCTRCKKPRKAGHQLVNQILPSQTYEGIQHEGFEFGVTGLEVGGIHVDNIPRPKKLKRKKAK